MKPYTDLIITSMNVAYNCTVAQTRLELSGANSQRVNSTGALSQDSFPETVVRSLPLALPPELREVGEEGGGAQMQALAPGRVGPQRHPHPLTGSHRHPAWTNTQLACY